MRFIRLASLSFVVVLGAAACGGTEDIPCTGSTCSCAPGDTCDLSGTDCGDQSCSVDCTDANQCAGECGASCSLDCSGGSTCNVTVGESGSVSCTDGSTCNITCTGSCSLSCSADSTCTLQCGDAEPQTIAEGGSCG